MAYKKPFKIKEKRYKLPVHAMKAYGESRGTAPLILNFLARGRRTSLSGRFPSEKYSGTLAGWASGLVWAFWIKEKSLVPTGFRTPDRPARSLVDIPTELPHFHILKILLLVK
jgi:hypothetical protein